MQRARQQPMMTQRAMNRLAAGNQLPIRGRPLLYQECRTAVLITVLPYYRSIDLLDARIVKSARGKYKQGQRMKERLSS